MHADSPVSHQPSIRPVRRGPADHLRKGLAALAQGHAQITAHVERAWASITFEGCRHTVTLSLHGHTAIAAGEHFIAALPDYEFTIPGYLVADATIAAVDHALLPTPHMEIVAELLLLRDI